MASLNPLKKHKKEIVTLVAWLRAVRDQKGKTNYQILIQRGLVKLHNNGKHIKYILTPDGESVLNDFTKAGF